MNLSTLNIYFVHYKDVYTQRFGVAKNHSYKKAIMGAVVTKTKW